MSAPQGRRAVPRSVYAGRVAALHEQGLPSTEIARRLRISRSYASELIHDPRGEKARQRKQQYGGTCENCGARTSYQVGGPSSLCPECARDERRIWTADAIVLALQEWVEEHGEIPRASIWLHTSTEGRRPPVGTVQRVFGSWNAGLKAAGLEPRRQGHYGRPGEAIQCCEEIAARYAAGESTRMLARAYGCAAKTIGERVVRGGGKLRPRGPFRINASDPFGVREARLAAGLSQRQLSAITGMGQPTISKVEHGDGPEWAVDALLLALEEVAVAA